MTRYSPLDRLVGIGVGADRDGPRLVAGLGQLLLQQLRRVRLDEQLRFEIEPGRQPHVGVRRPGEAVGAAVLAAAIGVDRAVEGDVGRLVAGDDLARPLDLHLGLERRQLLERAPAVVEGLDDLAARSGLRCWSARRGRAADRPGYPALSARQAGARARGRRPLGRGRGDHVRATLGCARRNSTCVDNYFIGMNVARTSGNIFHSCREYAALFALFRAARAFGNCAEAAKNGGAERVP